MGRKRNVSSDVRSSEYPQLTNIHPSYRTIELFFYLDPAHRPFSYCPFIIMEAAGTCNRNPKYFPLEVPSLGSHNKDL